MSDAPRLVRAGDVPLHLLLDREAPPGKFKITALGAGGHPWRVLTPAEADGDQWQFVCATFEDAIKVMDKWIRGRVVLELAPAELYKRIAGIR